MRWGVGERVRGQDGFGHSTSRLRRGAWAGRVALGFCAWKPKRVVLEGGFGETVSKLLMSAVGFGDRE